MAASVLDRYIDRLLLAERQRRARAGMPLRFDYASRVFAEQLAFIDDPADQAVALCGRRAGKSSAARILLGKTALERPGTVSAIVAPTRAMCKRLHWLPLLSLLRSAGIPHDANATELTIRLPNGSEIWLAGAKDATEIERLRGSAYALVIIDEAGLIRDDLLRVLVEDVLQWALVDHAGKLRLIGTPPPIPVGYFVERFLGKDAKGREIGGWSRHRWTLYQNTKLPNRSLREYLEKLKRDRGLSEESATWRREVLGELVYDREALVLSAFDLERSVYSPGDLPTDRATVVLGIDIGWHDSDAIIALGRYPGTNDLFVIEEEEWQHQTEEQLAAKTKEWIARYRPVSIVADTGGGGKKTVAGLGQRVGWEIKPAHKPSVVEQFERLNDEFRAGGERSRLRVPAGGICAGDAVRLRWEPGKQGQKVSKEPHSDVLPALSYAYAEAQRYFNERRAPEIDESKLTAYEREKLKR